MLRKIELINFLSYSQESVELDEATVSVVGDNGQGKSSLLEAVAFCLYGISRYKTINQLVRIGSSGDMVVNLTLGDLPTPGSSIVVTRGYSLKKEAGFLKVHCGEELLAKGGAAATNNPAQKYINNILGADVATFMLTAFFGLGGSDSLMKVGPAEKLEMLQRLAGASLCREINEAAGKERKAFEQKIKSEQRAAEVLAGVLKDNGELEASLESTRNDLALITGNHERALALKKELEESDSARRELLGKRDVLAGNRKRIEQEVKRAEGLQIEAQKTLQKNLADRETYTRSIESLQAELADKDELELDEARGNIQIEIALAKADWKLMDASLEADTGSGCPLCHGPVSPLVQEEWRARRDVALKAVSSAQEALGKVVEELRVVQASRKKLEAAEASLERIEGGIQDHQAAVERLEAGKLDLVKQREALDREVRGIQEKLETIEDVSDKLRKVEEHITRYVGQIAGFRNDIKHKQAELEESRKAQERAEELAASIVRLNRDMRAAALVEEAFSRYAIPMEMLKRLRKDIEHRASLLFREFAEGNVVIQDTEGARPGVEFVLVDGTGERTYDGLSEGEKTMFSMAVRIAVTQRENKLRDSKVDFLVLDEVSGHLSPGKRDALTMIIQKILKKYFRQIFMVSHAPMREIFSRTLEVKKVDGVSRVEAL